MELIFEWDDSKARQNFRKHHVSFMEARTVFRDPFLITFPDEYYSQHEDRYLSIGRSASGQVLIVVHTERDEGEAGLTIRIISCRRVTASERRTYEERGN